MKRRIRINREPSLGALGYHKPVYIGGADNYIDGVTVTPAGNRATTYADWADANNLEREDAAAAQEQLAQADMMNSVRGNATERMSNAVRDAANSAGASWNNFKNKKIRYPIYPNVGGMTIAPDQVAYGEDTPAGYAGKMMAATIAPAAVFNPGTTAMALATGAAGGYAGDKAGRYIAEQAGWDLNALDMFGDFGGFAGAMAGGGYGSRYRISPIRNDGTLHSDILPFRVERNKTDYNGIFGKKEKEPIVEPVRGSRVSSEEPIVEPLTERELEGIDTMTWERAQRAMTPEQKAKMERAFKMMDEEPVIEDPGINPEIYDREYSLPTGSSLTGNRSFRTTPKEEPEDKIEVLSAEPYEEPIQEPIPEDVLKYMEVKKRFGINKTKPLKGFEELPQEEQYPEPLYDPSDPYNLGYYYDPSVEEAQLAAWMAALFGPGDL